LQLNPAELSAIKAALAEPEQDHTALREQLKTKFLAASPATFLTPPEDRREGYPHQGRPEVGEKIYQLSCLHCHGEQRYSFFELGEARSHYVFLTRHFPRYTRYSTYQVSRYGTSPIPGKKAYMPHYTAERMSDQQVEDLRAYLAQAAK